MPGLLAMALWRLLVGDLVCAIGARGVHERGVGLIGVPLIRGAVPGHAVEMENLRCAAPAPLRFAWLHFQRQRLRQNCVRWKDPFHRSPKVFTLVSPRRVWKSRQSFRARAVAPEFRIDRKWNDAGRRRVVSGGREQAGLAQLAREARTVIRNRVWFELENPAAVVHGVKIARIVFAETDDLHRAVGQFPTPGELFAVVTQAPEL